jgi:hypothetical protein
MFSYIKYIYKLLHKIYLEVTSFHSTAVATFTEAVIYCLIYLHKYNTCKYRTTLIQICPWTWSAPRHVGVWGTERVAPHILSSAPDGFEWSVSGPTNFTWRKQPLRITKQESECVLQTIQTLSRRNEPLEGLRILCNNIYGLHTGKHLKHYASESLHATCISFSFCLGTSIKHYVSYNNIFFRISVSAWIIPSIVRTIKEVKWINQPLKTFTATSLPLKTKTGCLNI